MEIIPYLLSVLACLLVFHWNWTNSRRKSGEPVRGLFRYPDAAPPAPPPVARTRPGTRRRRMR